MSEPSARPGTEDQLPTARLQSILPPLPPPVPPPGPAHTTQRLRALTSGATVPAARRWRDLVSRVTRAASAVPANLGSAGREPWSQRKIGLSCGVLGAAMIVASIALGWASVTGEHQGKPEQLALAVTIVIARAALAIATMSVGYAVLRVGERLSFPVAPASTPREHHEG